MTYGNDVRDRLTEWLCTQLPDADNLAVEGLDRVEFGHSAEIMVLTIVSGQAGENRRDVVVRLRPKPPALLEPYDLAKQFTVLRALEGSPVRVPGALWLEDTGDVLGRPFFVMERVAGDVYEMEAPAVTSSGVKGMCESMAEQLAAIHTVDIAGVRLDSLDDGRNHLDREIEHWAGEMERVKRGTLPALERLLRDLKDSQPSPHPTIALVHGDAKPGNFAFVGDEVSAVFDWELTTIGDPLTDIGYLELLWRMPVGIPSHEAAPTIDAMIARYEAASGIKVVNREWYRAFNAFKLAVINLMGSMMFDDGVTDDQRFMLMAYGIPLFTQMGLADLGVSEQLDDGPIMPSAERMAQVQSGS